METPTTTSPNAEVNSWFAKNKLYLIFAGLFIISNLGIYFYQKYQQSKLRDQFNQEMVHKADLATQFAQHSNERLADALVKPLVWGIRGEMMRGNTELVNHFLTTVVQSTDIKLIAVVDMTGTVMISTDKQYEGKPVTEVLPTMPKETLKAGVQSASPEKMVATAPILGETEQLGVLYFEGVAGQKGTELLKALRENPFAEPADEK